MQKTGWFSSLRRQPKNSAKLKQQAEKKLQKSCVDLTTTPLATSGTPVPVDPLQLVKCEKCLRLFDSSLCLETTTTTSPHLNGDANIGKVGAKYSQSGSTTINKTISIDKVGEIKRLKDFATEYTEKISITRTTVVKQPSRKIEFFEVGPIVPPPPRIGSTTTTTTTTTTSSYNNRNGLVFDDNGKVLNSLNFDFEYIDTDNVIEKPQQQSPPGRILLDQSWVVLNSSSAGGGSPAVVNGPQLICDTCRNNNNNNNPSRYKSKSEWNLSSSKQIKDELFEVVTEMEGLESQEESKSTNKDKQMSIGRKKFNMDPKKGIEYLRENHLIRMDPQDVANFLYKGEGLNKTAIGDYLGEKNDFNEQVLKAFVELHDFTNLILVQALRQFLWSFRLPGEAQKIDRMMECFAQRYCQLNPDIFTNTDTCYVLSFAIIMLNTSLHNPSVKDKPTVEQFISMNRGINNGGDLPRELLESLYDSIRTEPFKIPQDDGNDLMHTFFNPDKEGWLWKQGGRYKSWKRRWFILNDNCLYYFEYTTDKEPRGIIPLENISVREIQDRNKPHCFELYASGGADIIKACKTDSEGKVVEGKHTVYRMSAATEEDKQEWIKCLAQSISHNPFYDILVQRKKKALAKS